MGVMLVSFSEKQDEVTLVWNNQVFIAAGEDTRVADVIREVLTQIGKMSDGPFELVERDVDLIARMLLGDMATIMNNNPSTSEAYRTLLPMARALTVFLP